MNKDYKKNIYKAWGAQVRLLYCYICPKKYLSFSININLKRFLIFEYALVIMHLITLIGAICTFVYNTYEITVV